MRQLQCRGCEIRVEPLRFGISSTGTDLALVQWPSRRGPKGVHSLWLRIARQEFEFSRTLVVFDVAAEARIRRLERRRFGCGYFGATDFEVVTKPSALFSAGAGGAHGVVEYSTFLQEKSPPSGRPYSVYYIGPWRAVQRVSTTRWAISVRRRFICWDSFRNISNAPTASMLKRSISIPLAWPIRSRLSRAD